MVIKMSKFCDDSKGEERTEISTAFRSFCVRFGMRVAIFILPQAP